MPRRPGRVAPSDRGPHVKRGSRPRITLDPARRRRAGDAAQFYDDLAEYYDLIFEDWDASMARQGAALEQLIRAEARHVVIDAAVADMRQVAASVKGPYQPVLVGRAG